MGTKLYDDCRYLTCKEMKKYLLKNYDYKCYCISNWPVDF